MAYKKLLFIWFSGSLLLWMMADRVPSAHSARLLRSNHATFYGGLDASGNIATSPKPVPAQAPITDDDNKEDTNAVEGSRRLGVCGHWCCPKPYGRCDRCCPKGPPA